MKLETDGSYIRLTPETKDELEAIHNLQYRGVTGSRLEGNLPDGAQLILYLGEDYIAKDQAHRAALKAGEPTMRIMSVADALAEELSEPVFTGGGQCESQPAPSFLKQETI